MRFFRLFVFVLLVVLATEIVIAGEGRTTLLATSDPFKGGVTADLYLETRPGTGKIFIESSPLTKVDTQISTRFAKEVACSYIGRTCNEIDFFYTIKANAAIIGGPSAGAAMAALTVAVLEGEELKESVAITGTINSGNIIGHVGGISEKLEAASKEGLTKVLIPTGETSSFSLNISQDPISYGRGLGIEVVEVFSLDEAMMEFTGQTFMTDDVDVEMNPAYNEVMRQLADGLCERTQNLLSKVDEMESLNETLEAVKEIAANLTKQGEDAKNENSHYAAASYCFGANVRFTFLEIFEKDFEDSEIRMRLREVNTSIKELEQSLGKAETISDAQILAVVRDRLDEAEDHVNQSLEELQQQREIPTIYQLAFAIERVESAHSWNKFYGVMKESKITEEMLKNACTTKVAEAQERVEYSSILLKTPRHSARGTLTEAQKFLEEKNYVQCLHKATISKSEANTLLSVYGVRDEQVQDIVERKIEAAETSIARQSKKEIFPIVGYSYFEYADSLKETDKYSALLFSDYALEFSNLEIYFKSNNETTLYVEDGNGLVRKDLVGFYFVMGFVIGAVMMAITTKKFAKKRKRILINKAVKKRKR